MIVNPFLANEACKDKYWTAMAFLSRWGKANSPQQDMINKKILLKLGTVMEKSGSLSARKEEQFRFCLSISLLTLSSLILIVAVPPIFRGEQFLLHQPVASHLAISNLKAERASQNLLQRPEIDGASVFIEDAVILPEDVLLLLRLPPGFIMDRNHVSCTFNHRKSKALGVDDIGRRTVVRCGIPSEGIPALARGVKLLIQSNEKEEIVVEALNKSMPFWSWDHLVFESIALPNETILFAKGYGEKHGQEMDTDMWRCSFDGLVDTKVIAAAQEVFVCENPPHFLLSKLSGKKVTLRREGELIPSVTYYQPDQLKEFSDNHYPRSSKSFLCACTMIFNGAKFLKEWVSYHSFLGVQHFYVYDNNSEDDLQDTVRMLALSNYSISRHPWPWIKTQEAGFSHCSQQARSQCTWMMYTDIDEFIFPMAAQLPQLTSNSSTDKHPPSPKFISSPNLLQTLILKTTMSATRQKEKQQIGQISIKCREFGPSGLRKTPPEGVMEGYTCRMKKQQRHKSIVLMDAIAKPRINIVHHFKLQQQYMTVQLSMNKAVINHYKYQVWEEFKNKFRRRVSAYVVDWREEKKMESRDRAPGLGTSAKVEPLGWENMFCEVHDTALRDYARFLSNSSLNFHVELYNQEIDLGHGN